MRALFLSWSWCSRCLFAMTALAIIMATMPARAEVKVDNQVLQSGLFSQAGCKPSGMEGFNECACLADIHYPVISGSGDADKEKKLNATFRDMADKQKCVGTETQSDGKDEPSSSTYNFDISYQSPTLLGLKYESWSYTGGAHGNGSVAGMIIDLTKGTIISQSELLDMAQLPALNKFIYEALSAEPEGEVFHDSIEGFKGVFITASDCKSCTLVLSDEGVKVVFQTYAVSSFANGPMEVQIPAQYVLHPAVKDALAHLKPAPAPPAADAPAAIDAPASEMAAPDDLPTPVSAPVPPAPVPEKK